MRNVTPRAALSLALIYALVAGLWILLSNRLLGTLTADPGLLTHLDTLKDGAFVVVTAFLLYLLLRRELRRLEDRDAQVRDAQAALREGEQQLYMQNMALQSAANAVMITDREGRITWTNSAFTRLTGYTAAEALGQTPRLLKSGRHDQEFYQRLWETILSGQVWRGEMTNRRKDGSLFTEELTITPVRDERGAISQFIGIQQDITERKRAEGALREGEEKFRNLVENTSDWVWEINERGVYTYCSPRIREILGYAPEEILGKTPFDLMPSEEAKRVAELFAPISGAREPFALLDNVNLHKDGHSVILETSATPILDSRGMFRGYRGIDRDITERKRAEEALREANETLRALVRASPLAIMALDPAGNVKTWNPAAERIFGWSIEEVLGRPLPIVPDEKQEEFLALRQRVLQGESYTGVEVRRKKRDGSPIEISISTAPLRDAHGEISGIMGVVADVTERKRMVEALIRRTRQLDALRAVGTEITRELDLPTLLGLIVRRAAELVGAASGTVFLWDERDQVLVAEAWHGFADWRRGVRLQLGEAVAGTTAQRREGMIVNDYRTSPYAHPVTLDRTGITAVLAEPLLYHDRLVGVLTINNEGTGRHFTEEDRATLALFATQAAIAIENARLYQEIQQHAAELEERVRERTRALEEASRHKSEFLANMSHELRTPLNSIIGFAEFLQEQRVGSLNEKQARYLGHIRASGQHLVQIIGDILDLSKAEAGRIVLQPESLSVATTLEDILVTTRGLAHQKNQIVEADIQPDLPPLWADPIRFKQILFNLLNNAVKFTPNGGRITVGARQVFRESENGGTGETGTEPGREGVAPIHRLTDSPVRGERTFLEIRVSDTGIGIKTEDLPRLFQQFVQLEATATKHHEGTGLGLALAKRLVELHGGRIWAQSAGEGQGSTFTVILPFTQPSQ